MAKVIIIRESELFGIFKVMVGIILIFKRMMADTTVFPLVPGSGGSDG